MHGHYSIIFTVPEPGRKRPLNEQVLKKKFCRDTVKAFKSLLKAGDFGVVVDLSNACFSAKLHKISRSF